MAHRGCIQCGRSIMVYNPRWKIWVVPDEDHDLCAKCWKAEQDRARPVEERGPIPCVSGHG